jgi:hypothetical protein
VTRRPLGAGAVIAVGAWGEGVVRATLEHALRGAGVPFEALPEGVRVSRRAGLSYVQNWSRGAQTEVVADRGEPIVGSPLLGPAGVSVFPDPDAGEAGPGA